jgi:hypothetical protein
MVARSILFHAHIFGSLLFIVTPPNASCNTKIISTAPEWKGCFSKHHMQGVRVLSHATLMFV